MTGKSARLLVVEALGKVDLEDAWSGPVIDSALSRSGLSSEDKSFATALFYTTLVRRYTADIVIKKYSARPIKKLDNQVLNVLRISVCQLLYMDSVPDHAAVAEGVKLCRQIKKSSASGFVNAVLRGFIRDDKLVPIPRNASRAEQLAIKYSCPPQLINMWIADYGEEGAVKLLEQSLKTPETFVRTNTEKTSIDQLIYKLEEENIKATKSLVVENCALVESGTRVYGTNLYESGFFHIQDISSQKAALCLEPQKGERVLDCCSAPGGKTFILAQEVGEKGSVVACDLYSHRLAELSRRQKVLGLTNITAKVLDMSVYHEELGGFDKVICDVPCSGLGTIRRRPEVKYQDLNEIKALPDLQYSILNHGGKYCKKGGILVYSTCTLLNNENMGVVNRFLSNNPDFKLITTEFAVNNIGKNTIAIGVDGGDGFFIAAFTKN